MAEGSVNGVLDGKQYNQAVTAQKCVYKVLMRLAWRGFITWSDIRGTQAPRVHMLLERVSNLAGNIMQEPFEHLLQSPILDDILVVWMEFVEKLCSNNGELSALWMTYVDTAENVASGTNARIAKRETGICICMLYKQKIPWCFAYDKFNYARYLTPY